MNRNPGLIAMRLILGFALPATLFLVLYLPVLSSLYGILESLASSDGIRHLLESPQETLSMLLAPVLISYIALLVCLFAAFLGGMLSEAASLRILSGELLEPGAEVPARLPLRAGRGHIRPLMLYSLVYSIALILVLMALAFILIIVFAMVAALDSVHGSYLSAFFMQTMLMVTASAAFMLSLVFLYSIRLEGLAFLFMDKLRPLEAFIKASASLIRNPGYASGIGIMVVGFAILQPLMALAVLGIARVPDAGAWLALGWAFVWLVLDIYLGLFIKATVFSAHYKASESSSRAGLSSPSHISLDEVAVFLDAEDSSSHEPTDVWEYFERDGDTEENNSPKGTE